MIKKISNKLSNNIIYLFYSIFKIINLIKKQLIYQFNNSIKKIFLLYFINNKIKNKIVYILS